jgi:hypothetical protein
MKREAYIAAILLAAVMVLPADCLADTLVLNLTAPTSVSADQAGNPTTASGFNVGYAGDDYFYFSFGPGFGNGSYPVSLTRLALYSRSYSNSIPHLPTGEDGLGSGFGVASGSQSDGFEFWLAWQGQVTRSFWTEFLPGTAPSDAIFFDVYGTLHLLWTPEPPTTGCSPRCGFATGELTMTPVPEPSSILLVCSGVLGLATKLRRKL